MNEFQLRNQKIDLYGRSMILNLLSIVLNLTGVFFVVKGFHITAGENSSLYITIGFSLVVLSLVTLIILKGMFLFSYVSRALVGGLFIVSGLVKANDPWGFAFKLEEYFAPDGLSFDYPFFEFFEPYALELSILICIAEIVLGVAVIVGGKIKLTSWLLVVMMIFFSWLTWYTTSCNDAQLAAMETGEEFNRQCVTDCGCFGDALRGSVGRSLTPIESFWKDLVLFYFVLIIFANQWKIRLNTVRENWAMVPASLIVIIFFSWVFGWLFPIFFATFTILGAFIIGNLNIGKIEKPWKMAMFVALVTFIFGLYTTLYLPLKDYRPYRIGNNIKEEMAKGTPAVSEFIFQYEDIKTGEIVEFAADQWEIYTDTTKYRYHDRIEKVIVEGVDAPITDFLASIKYENLGEAEKQNPYIDSVIQADYSFYYDEFITVSAPAYGTVDTISAFEYSPEFYPDSIYKAGERFTQLIDPNIPFVLDVTEYLLTAEHVFLMTMRDIKTINESSIEDFKALYEEASAAGIPFYVLSPATQEEIDEFKAKFEFYPTFLQFDGIEVKIIVRSNPGLAFLEKGTVLDKWPSRSIPEFEDVKEDFLTE